MRAQQSPPAMQSSIAAGPRLVSKSLIVLFIELGRPDGCVLMIATDALLLKRLKEVPVNSNPCRKSKKVKKTKASQSNADDWTALTSPIADPRRTKITFTSLCPASPTAASSPIVPWPCGRWPRTSPPPLRHTRCRVVVVGTAAVPATIAPGAALEGE